VFDESARTFAERMLAVGPASDSQRIEWLMRTAVGRRPTPTETRILTDYLREASARHAGNATENHDRAERGAEGEAEPLAEDSEKDSEKNSEKNSENRSENHNANHNAEGARNTADLGAWTGVCSVILNLHEFVTRE
jgi:hypothetical protein